MSDEPGLAARLRAALAEQLPAAAQLRHRLHADPRPSGAEADTAAVVLAALGAGAGTPVAGTGAAVAFGAAGSPSIALRAELDALPVREDSGVPWAARGDYMHACGHDVHLAALVAAARAITACAAPVAVTALLQPREESAPSGAQDVVASGVLGRLGVRAVIGAHVQPRVAAGVAAVTPGLVNAAVDELEITVVGRTGHVGYPHTVRDPILALAAIITALQQLPSRRVDPVSGAVCVLTEVHAGSAVNIVPGQAVARGSLRVMDDAERRRCARLVTEIVEYTAAAHGCSATVRFTAAEPPVINDQSLAAAAAGELRAAGYPVRTDFRSFGADDFAHYAAAAPALMIFVGVEGPGLHDPRFVPPDEAIRAVGDALLAGYLAAVRVAADATAG